MGFQRFQVAESFAKKNIRVRGYLRDLVLWFAVLQLGLSVIGFQFLDKFLVLLTVERKLHGLAIGFTYLFV